MRREARILFWGSNLWYFAEEMLGPLFAIFAQEIGGNVLDITWAWATFLFFMGTTIIIVGRMSDRLGRRGRARVMIFGYGLNAVFTFGYLLVSDPMHLFFVQAGLGIAAALAIPTWLALYDQYSDDVHNGYEWGLTSGMDRIFMAAGLMIGGYVVTTFSFDALFLTMGCVQLVATLYQARILRPTT